MRLFFYERERNGKVVASHCNANPGLASAGQVKIGAVEKWKPGHHPLVSTIFPKMAAILTFIGDVGAIYYCYRRDIKGN